ncbi:MAG: HAD family phosphatase [Planctomycetota bacterium]|nr:MAG: HAD family phosphatase [Planctomycetota bacterium]
MPRYRLLALDVDGTLVNSRHELTGRTRDALLHARAQGIEIVLATGRRYSRALPLVEPLELNVPLITASGALVKRAADHQTLFRARFMPGALERCLEAVAGDGYEAVLYADTYDEGFDFYHRGSEFPRGELVEFFRKNEGFGRLWPELMTRPPDEIFGGFVMGTHEEMLRLAERLHQRVPDSFYLHVLRSPRYRGFMCEIAPAGVSKWTAVRRMADQWGIATEEICAVGDDVNDIPMIEAAGLGIAMGNARPEVKAVAQRIAPDHDEDGLVQVVDWLLR